LTALLEPSVFNNFSFFNKEKYHQDHSDPKHFFHPSKKSCEFPHNIIKEAVDPQDYGQMDPQTTLIVL